MPNQFGISSVARLVLNAPVGQKVWTYDDNMPYGRVVSDAVLQPNGNILIFNGARKGITGGSIGTPLMFGTANGIIIYIFLFKKL